MNRKIKAGILFIFIALAFNSCEPLGTCKICRQVIYENGVVIDEGAEAEYCDADLIAIEAKEDLVVGNTRTTWECR
jgi:hypothetical protein